MPSGLLRRDGWRSCAATKAGASTAAAAARTSRLRKARVIGSSPWGAGFEWRGEALAARRPILSIDHSGGPSVPAGGGASSLRVRRPRSPDRNPGRPEVAARARGDQQEAEHGPRAVSRILRARARPEDADERHGTVQRKKVACRRTPAEAKVPFRPPRGEEIDRELLRGAARGREQAPTRCCDGPSPRLSPNQAPRVDGRGPAGEHHGREQIASQTSSKAEQTAAGAARVRSAARPTAGRRRPPAGQQRALGEEDTERARRTDQPCTRTPCRRKAPRARAGRCAAAEFAGRIGSEREVGDAEIRRRPPPARALGGGRHAPRRLQALPSPRASVGSGIAPRLSASRPGPQSGRPEDGEVAPGARQDEHRRGDGADPRVSESSAPREARGDDAEEGQAQQRCQEERRPQGAGRGERAGARAALRRGRRRTPRSSRARSTPTPRSARPRAPASPRPNQAPHAERSSAWPAENDRRDSGRARRSRRAGCSVDAGPGRSCVRSFEAIAPAPASRRTRRTRRREGGTSQAPTTPAPATPWQQEGARGPAAGRCAAATTADRIRDGWRGRRRRDRAEPRLGVWTSGRSDGSTSPARLQVFTEPRRRHVARENLRRCSGSRGARLRRGHERFLAGSVLARTSRRRDLAPGPSVTQALRRGLSVPDRRSQPTSAWQLRPPTSRGRARRRCAWPDAWLARAGATRSAGRPELARPGRTRGAAHQRAAWRRS